MLAIDGSQGEGGGQVLRTAIALSLVTGVPLRLENVRAGRRKPGLLRQHLTAVTAAAAISGAELDGATLGSQALTFRPGAPRPGDYTFDVGSAGSTTLVAQTLLPALLRAGGPSRLTLRGGTHNPLAPPFDSFARAYLPLLARMGAHVAATLVRPGFYPAGGGEMRLAITPAAALAPLDLRARGALVRREVRALVASLPAHIAEREIGVVVARLGWDPAWGRAEEIRDAVGLGNVVMCTLESEHVTEVLTGFGAKGIPAETVAARLAESVAEYLGAGVPVGEHLCDQLLLPLALAGGGVFRTLALSSHARTQAALVAQFLDVEVQSAPVGPGAWEVTVAKRG
ncbi:MAG TPA: RNA 3'-terminal phosphate cyclase [Polyangia bacterium]|jgi:RNA 3'-terminal phosphate cyclase (ATP)